MPALNLSPENDMKERTQESFPLKNTLVDRRCNLYIEEYFHEMLALESRKVARHQRTFLLMRLDVTKIVGDTKDIKLLTKIVNVLTKFTRDTDIKGWYKSYSEIGVIFTELRELNQDFIISKIHNKLFKNLSSILNLDQLSNIDLTFRFIPEEYDRQSITAFPTSNPTAAKEEPLSDDSADASAVAAADDSSGDVHSFPAAGDEKIARGFSKQRWFLLTGDLILISTMTFLSIWLRYKGNQDMNGASTGAFILSLGCCALALYIFDMYNMGRRFYSVESMQRVGFAVLLGGLLSTFFFYLLPHWHFGRGILLIQMLLLWIAVTAWRTIYGSLFQANRTKMGALVLGTGQSGRAIGRLLNSPLSPYEVKGYLCDRPQGNGKAIANSGVLGTIDELDKIVRQVWVKAAILATPRNTSPELIRKIIDARLQGMEVVDMPTIYERLTGRVPVKHIEDEWLLYADGFYLLSKEYVQKVKRVVDIFVSALMLLCFVPVMAMTALLIRADSSGPVFYRQNRIGKYGRPFSLIKFRSMHQDAEMMGAVWAAKRDSRVTRVGRWIRVFRIDEIPQLLNVFRGEMSLIGPRPERPEFVKELETIIPYYAVRHSVEPGVTGWAQVNYPYGASVEDALHKLEYDLYYIKNMSLFLDLKIFLRTIGVVLAGDGAR